MKGGVYFINQIKELPIHSIHPNHILHSSFLFNNAQRMDYDWMTSQFDYLSKMSPRQIDIIRSYTTFTDKIVNNYLRGTLTPFMIEMALEKGIPTNDIPFKHQHYDKTGTYRVNNVKDAEYHANIKQYINEYIREFSELIREAPPLVKPVTVFRGVKEDGFIAESLLQNEETSELYLINKGFTSTTFRIESAVSFIDEPCCIIELELMPSMPCMIAGYWSRSRSEFEIIMLPDMRWISKGMAVDKSALVEDEDYESMRSLTNPEESVYPVYRTYEFRVSV